MNIPTNHQIITHQGMPVAVVIPYEEYAAVFRDTVDSTEESTIPHEVVQRVLKEQISPVRAWREYLGLTQAEIARRLGISQPAYAQMETPERNCRVATVKKLATALGITLEQLKW
jgi:DNA-binding XRE family transcriptional regulator